MKRNVIKPVYYGNWSDLWGFPLASYLLPVATRIPFLTPNVVTLIGFTAFSLGSLFLFLNFPNHLLVAAFLLPFGFLMDDLDGQLARATGKSSELGNYLDKVLDVLKIFILTSSLSYAVYLQTHSIVSIYLGFIACAFFYIRYYIKLETVLNQAGKDSEYLSKSSQTMKDVEAKRFKKEQALSKTFVGKLKVAWMRNRTVLFVDEAEFAVFTAVFAALGRLEMGLWVLAVSQVFLFVFRAIERAHQTITRSDRLYYFMRK